MAIGSFRERNDGWPEEHGFVIGMCGYDEHPFALWESNASRISIPFCRPFAKYYRIHNQAQYCVQANTHQNMLQRFNRMAHGLMVHFEKCFT